MLIHVTAIPEEGQVVALDRNTGWLRALLTQRYPDLNPQLDTAEGEVQIYRTLQNVSLAGDLRLRFHPNCARCGLAFDADLEIPVQRHLVPYFKGPREEMLSEEEEIELSADDLDFSFYHKEEFDLAEIVGEEITLALPMRFLCQEDCKGLCPHCGQNLNQGACACDGTDDFSPFSALKNIKLKS